MKINTKKLVILVLIIVAVVLAIYSNKSSSLTKNHMTIEPAKLSQETQDILDMIYDDTLFLNYKVDKTAKSYSINLWQFDQENDEWKDSGSFHGAIDQLENKIAIRLTDNKLDFFKMSENGNSNSSLNLAKSYFSSAGIRYENKLSKPTWIKLNEEIVLFKKLGTDKGDLSTDDIIHSMRGITDSECSVGIAVTIMISDKVFE